MNNGKKDRYLWPLGHHRKNTHGMHAHDKGLRDRIM